MGNKTLTTFDNPFNPYKDFDQWYAFDTSPTNGYNTCQYIARVADYKDLDMSEEEWKSKTDAAYQTILDNDFQGLYRLIDEDEDVDPELALLYKKQIENEMKMT